MREVGFTHKVACSPDTLVITRKSCYEKIFVSESSYVLSLCRNGRDVVRRQRGVVLGSSTRLHVQASGSVYSTRQRQDGAKSHEVAVFSNPGMSLKEADSALVVHQVDRVKDNSVERG